MPRWVSALLLLLFLAFPASAARSDPLAESELTGTLELAGRTVFTFRAPRGAYTAEQRATAATVLLERTLEQGREGVGQRPGDGGVLILVGGREVFSVLAEDVDALAGETLESLTADTVARLERALAERGEARSLSAWGLALGKSALTLVVAFLLVRFLLGNNKRLYTRLGKMGVLKSTQLRSTELRLLGQQSMVPLARGLATLITWSLVALVVYVALDRLLLAFPYTRPLGERLHTELVEEIRSLALALVQSLPGLAVVVFIWLAARFGVGVVKRYFRAAERGQLHSHLAEAVTPAVAERLIAALVWLGALVVAFPYIPGSSTGAFQGVTVFAGLMVSLGSTSLVGQMASGIVLAYSRAFRVGDFVRFGEHEGTVVSFGLLATKIRTARNEEINVPNTVFTTATTTNYSRFAEEEGVFLSTRLSLGYDIPWRRIHELLLGAARRTDGIRAEPAPCVLQTALSDFYVEYELRAAALEPARRQATLSALHANILDDFGAAGVEILSPHHLHLRGPGQATTGQARPLGA